MTLTFAKRPVLIALLAVASTAYSQALAQNVTASVSGNVTSANGSPIRSSASLRAGDTIKTGAGSSVTLMLKDRTAFTVNENASVRVSGTAGGIGGTGFDVEKGGFRLITGEQDPSTYRIKTPQATLGVRGTIIEGFVDIDLGIELFVLVEGAFQVATPQGVTPIEQPASYVVVSEGGKVSPPSPWPGELLSFGASINLSQAYLDIIQQYGRDPLPRFSDFNAGFKARTYDSRFPPAGQGAHQGTGGGEGKGEGKGGRREGGEGGEGEHGHDHRRGHFGERGDGDGHHRRDRGRDGWDRRRRDHDRDHRDQDHGDRDGHKHDHGEHSEDGQRDRDGDRYGNKHDRGTGDDGHDSRDHDHDKDRKSWDGNNSGHDGHGQNCEGACGPE